MFGEKKDENKIKLIQNIISVGDVDTVFRDIYLEHVRDLLSGTFSPDGYKDIIREKNMLSRFPNRINEAMEKNEWETVKELSVRMKDLHRWIEDNDNLFEIGRKVYSSDFIYINPFSPGLYHESGISIDDLPAIRNDVIQKLDDIILSDKSIGDFYSNRKDCFSSIQLLQEDDGFQNDEGDLAEQAKQALEHGDINRLEELSETIININKPDTLPFDNDQPVDVKKGEEEKRLFDFSDITLKKAEKLGLKAARVETSPQYASLCRHAIRREFKIGSAVAWKKILETDPLFKEGVSEFLKTWTEVFSKHLFINSVGTRHLPDFVTEDLLVEDFSENDLEKVNASPLIKILGFDKRTALSRLDIEQALFINGYRIVKDELGLNPIDFKLVCIPSDIYLRLGEDSGWGEQELWTHFDGYGVLQHSRFNALAGGDKRFGGIFDLVTIGREYESDHVIARFAVVQRKRMLKMI